MNLPIKMINNVVQIENYDLFKKDLISALNEKYRPIIIQNAQDLILCKESRAELNKLSKNINDAKIEWVRDVTGLLVSQVKEICDIITTKSDEFNQEIKNYTNAVDKKKFGTITIDAYNEEEYNHIIRVLKRAKIDYKEKILNGNQKNDK